MKSVKMIFLMVSIGMMLITSCSTEKEELNTNEKTNSKEVKFNRNIEESQNLQAIEFTKKSIEDKNNEEAKTRVKWCPNYDNPWNTQNGTGIAEVTLDDGSVHYVAANWENHGACCGGLIYETYYIGSELPSNYSC